MLRTFLTGIFIALMISITPILAVGYIVGVKMGDWIEYEVDGSWGGAGKEPPVFKSDWIKIEVQNVRGTEVTLLFTTHYPNGTEETETLSWDIERQGWWWWLVSAGLKKGDVVFPTANSILNDTLTKVYAGAIRSVNLLNVSTHSKMINVTMTAYWDQTTGILVELLMESTTLSGTSTLRYSAVETNMWSPTPLHTIAQLSPETAAPGEPTTISVTVKDDAGNPIEGANVTATIGDLEALILLSDQGGGNYQATIDTLNIKEGTYDVVVTAKKEGYQSAQT